MNKPIVLFPDDRLTTVCDPVDEITPEIQAICADLADTMLGHGAAGIAAPQIGVNKRIFILDSRTLGGTEFDPAKVYINPRIDTFEDDKYEDVEGCLSFLRTAGEGYTYIKVKVPRYRRIWVAYTNFSGQLCEDSLDGFAARAFQHEFDHLNGKLMVDYVDFFQKQRIERLSKQFIKMIVKNHRDKIQ